jgi:hypothetical protein
MLYFRVDDDNQAAFEEAASLSPLKDEKNVRTIDLAFWRRWSGCLTNPMSSSSGRDWRCRRPPRGGERTDSAETSSNASADAVSRCINKLALDCQ